jgi:hypothetical protein
VTGGGQRKFAKVEKKHQLVSLLRRKKSQTNPGKKKSNLPRHDVMVHK